VITQQILWDAKVGSRATPIPKAYRATRRKFQMNATQLAKTTNGKAVEELDVLVVGAGFAGLYQLDHLRWSRAELKPARCIGRGVTR
jgi:hypothetical protein